MKGPFRSLLCLMIITLFPATLSLSAAPTGDIEGVTTSVVDPIDSPSLPPWGYYKGILPLPEKNGDIAGSFANASEYTDFVPVWGRPSPFYNLSKDLEGSWGDIFVEDLIRGNGMFPLVHMNFYGQNLTLVQHPSLASSSLSSPEWRSLYIQAAKDVVNASSPLYLSLGNEVNRWLERYGSEDGAPNSFMEYVSLYHEAYDAVKKISPDTMVFCTFSREIVSEGRESDMRFIELFDPERLDMLVLTSYPYSLMGIDRVEELPDDYYSSVFNHISRRPFGLSEVAWTSNMSFGGQPEQAAFVRNLTGRLTIDQGIDLELLGWNWLHDLGPGDETGLIDETGVEKLALEVWKGNSEPGYRRANRTINIQEDFGTYIYSLNRTFFDPDPWDILTYRIWNGSDYTNETTHRLHAMIDDGNLVLASLPDVNGIEQLRIEVKDWTGETNWTIIQVTIEDVNDAPRAILPALPIRFGEGGSPFVQLSAYFEDVDNDLETLRMDLIEAPGLNLSWNLSVSEYMVVYAEEEDWYGDTYILMRVIDPEGASAVINLSVEVFPINDPPRIRAPGEISFDEDEQVVLELSRWVDDRDGPETVWNITADDLNITILMNGDTIAISSAPDWWGSTVIHLNLSDSIEFDTYDLLVTVREVNDAPIIDDLSGIVLIEDHDLFIPFSALGPLDPDGDPLYWYIENTTDLVETAMVLGNQSIHLVPRMDGYGTGSFRIRVEDGRGGVDRAMVDFTVIPVNDPPVFIAPREWTYDLPPGGEKTIDLSNFPYFVEDVDDPVSTLNIITDYPLTLVDGLTFTLTVPDDTASQNITVMIGIEDPHGARSEVNRLLLVIVEGGEETVIHVENLTVSGEGNEILVEASGEHSQTIWAVFTDGSGARTSFILPETPRDSGTYRLIISDPPWSEGAELTLHLSRTRDGDNHADIPEVH
ncbi:MAG: tandem-95 repeat protein, partial [Candidatus Thermoplasmatota archaeon]|nr:tandem-95 repeat protein [Candidatus Thermoplasmatota archaeon]